MEKIYIGTKIIAAEVMDEHTFLKIFKKVEVSDRENQPGYRVRYEDGYISWSPKETFERAYREVTSFEVGLVSSTIPKEDEASE